MDELRLLKIMLDARFDRARNASERGATAVEWVVITAILVAIATAIGLTLSNLIKGKADSINLDTP